MAKYQLKIPKLGESVIEATVTAWLKEVGDTIALDDGILEVATDKVDTEIPSEVEGVLVEKLVQVDEVAKIGQVVAIIEIEVEDVASTVSEETEKIETPPVSIEEPTVSQVASFTTPDVPKKEVHIVQSSGDRFYSPLVRNIAKTEGISQEELDALPGTGMGGRVTKDDILGYLENRGTHVVEQTKKSEGKPKVQSSQESVQAQIPVKEGDEKVPMDRMGKLIAEHMIKSTQTSAHVQSFIEVDVTKVVEWREKNKHSFVKQNGEKLTYTPIFMKAVAQVIKEYPMVNISVEGDAIIKKKDINLGMAAALPDGNLIVPVIKNADELSLVGMAKAVNKLAQNARNNKLSPDDISGGTYTVTNIGSFGSIAGTPIINQPQVAILGLGAIRKMPAVVETDQGDFIGIRHMMILSHSYDHRVINGALGGMFILRLKEILEAFDGDTF
jgi:2-oxoglutarate dehydrogenase E2 component (dihydrolipoamide succinyltransferase)